MIKSKKLFEEYANLKAIILSIAKNQPIEFINKNEQKKYILEYREFVLNSKYGIYPLFLFSKYNEDVFEKCFNYLKSGHTLAETDKYFINMSENKKNKKL